MWRILIPAWVALGLASIYIIVRHRRIRVGEPEVKGAVCPHCGSANVAWDIPNALAVATIVLFFPLGLVLLALHKDVWCRECRIRFKRP